MSTWSEVLAQTRREIEEVTEGTWFDTSLLASANDVILDIVRKTGGLFDEMYADTVAGTNAYELPTGTISIDEVRCNGRDLTQVGISDFPPAETSGAPVSYAVEGGNLYLTPTPDAVYVLRLFRHYLPDALVTTADTMPFDGVYDGLVRTYIKARAYEQILDWESARNFDAIYQRELEVAAFDATATTNSRTAPVEVR